MYRSGSIQAFKSLLAKLIDRSTRTSYIPTLYHMLKCVAFLSSFCQLSTVQGRS